MPLTSMGEPLTAGVPDYTDDERFWDGHRFFQPVRRLVLKGEGRLLREATVVVNTLTDCCPGTDVCGSKRVLDQRSRTRLADAGFVRFRDEDGHLEVWRADDGATLALLVGEVSRPSLA